MLYYRLVKNKSFNTLLPLTESVYNHVDYENEWYVSMGLYTEAHKKEYEKTGSFAGFKGVIFKRLYFDLDSTDLTETFKDGQFLVKKLKEFWITPRIFFSGSKGIHIDFTTNDCELSIEEVKRICLGFAEGLNTVDTSTLYQNQTLLRLPLTLNPKSIAYKIPLTEEMLNETSIDEIKALSKDKNYIKTISFKDIRPIPQQIYKEQLLELFKHINMKTSNERRQLNMTDGGDIKWNDIDVTSVDFTHKPDWLTSSKYLLQEGFFPSGTRNHAMMILATTYKSFGFNDELCYRMLKGVAETQAKRFDVERFSDAEIYNNIIKVVYSPTWAGGVYSAYSDPLLAKLDTLIPPSLRETTDKNEIVDSFVGDDLSVFASYALAYDKNRINFGLKALDNKLKIMTTHLVGLIGAPGASKTSFALTVLNNMSKQNVHSIFFSYDMSRTTMTQKLIQKHTDLDSDSIFDIYKKKQYENMVGIKELLVNEYQNTHFVYKNGQTVEDIRQTVINIQKRHSCEVKLIVVDYLELVMSRFSDPTQASSEIIQKLRQLANEMNLAILILLQPNKISTKLDEPILSYTAAKGASSIAQACTSMMTICRDGYSSSTPETDKYVSIHIVKNRLGALGNVSYSWEGQSGNIRELTSEERANLLKLREEKEAKKKAEGGSEPW